MIIENTYEAKEQYKKDNILFTDDWVELSKEDIEALLDGKAIAVDVNSEFAFFITLQGDK